MKTAKNIVKGKSPPAQASKFHPSPHPVLDRLGRVLAVGLLLGGLALPLQADDLGDALDAPGLVWTTGGTSGGTPWFVQTTNTHDGVAAAQSGTSTNFWASSWLQTSVTGRVTVVY